ncbi:HNH endonuclease [Vibrio parahaemolyticus]|nr:HNH endonuclease [Vibrio parahaemolyticus]
MLSSIDYTEKELEIINSKLNEHGFNSDTWSDVDIEKIKNRIKKHYIEKQKYRCPYCKQKTKSKNGKLWDIEHIIPRKTAPQFMFEPKNLCASCIECNNFKSDKKVTSSKAVKTYPTQSRLFSIIHPHFDIYEEHILVVKEGFYYVALKKKGAKTIEVCNLNRFYEFSEFGACVQDDDRIFLLSEQLRKTKDLTTKKQIRKEIAVLAIKGAV